MTGTMKTFRGALAGKARTETLNGREHVVVPVVALMEGVIHAMNAETPELVRVEELAKFPGGWNGRPVFLGHPLQNGKPVSGGDPAIQESLSVGQIFHTKIAGKKLVTEAWIDVEKAKTVDPTILTRIADGDPIEVSAGTFVETDDTTGTYHGKKYVGEWHNLVPDHLALLDEGDLGACSREMGCGVRAAKGDSVESMYREWLEEDGATESFLKTLRNIPQSARDKMPKEDFAGPNDSFPIEKPGDVKDAADSLGRAKGDRDAIKKKIISIAYRKGASFVAQLPDDWKKKKDQKNAGVFQKFLSMFRTAQPAAEMSNTDLTRKLYDALREMAGANVMNVEAFLPVTNPNRVVYTCYEPAVELGMGYPYTTYVMYERAFTLDANGIVTLGEAALEVEPVLSYSPVLMAEEPEPTVAKGARNSKADQEKIQAMHDHAIALGAYCEQPAPKTAAGSCQCGNHAAKETNMNEKEMQTFLASATPEQLKTLGIAKLPTEAEIKAAADAKSAAEKAAADAALAATTAAATVAAPTFEQLLAAAPADMRAGISAGAAAVKAAKDIAIKTLKDSKRCDLTDAQLNGMSQGDLDSLVKLAGIKAAVDFSGQGLPRAEGSEQTVAPPPSLDEKIKAARAAKK